MRSAVRYAVTVYVGLLMAGALMHPPGMSYGSPMPSGSAKLAPLKVPYAYPAKPAPADADKDGTLRIAPTPGPATLSG